MGFFDMFRRPALIVDGAALGTFIDENAAFLVQKGIYEYSRARAGHYSKVLFSESGFRTAVEDARWRAYPLGLAMVSELAEGVLRPHAGDDRRLVLDGLIDLVLTVFDRYPVPAPLDPAAWAEARRDLAHHLDLVGLHAPKAARDIPEQFAKRYFATMPIYEKLRTPDFPTLRNYMRVTLCNIHDELTKRMDAPALAAALSARKVAGPAGLD